MEEDVFWKIFSNSPSNTQHILRKNRVLQTLNRISCLFTVWLCTVVCIPQTAKYIEMVPLVFKSDIYA